MRHVKALVSGKQLAMVLKQHTTKIVKDLRRRLVLADLDNDLRDRIYRAEQV